MKWRSLEESTPGSDTRLLREILAERKQLIEKYVPEEVRAVHLRAIDDLRKLETAQKALKAGARLPDFELPDQNGLLISSRKLLDSGFLVVSFIRGRWCPFCVAQLEAMNLMAEQLRAAGATFAAISPQTAQQSFFMADQHKLRFPLLSDSGNRVARQFGLVYRVPEYQQAIYKRAFVNLPFANGDDSWELPVPATFIAGSEGNVNYSWADEDYTRRPEPAKILQALTSFSNPGEQNPPVR